MSTLGQKRPFKKLPAVLGAEPDAPLRHWSVLTSSGRRSQTWLMQGISRALRHLAIIALLVRAMLPAGWMPDAQGLVHLFGVPVARHPS